MPGANELDMLTSIKLSGLLQFRKIRQVISSRSTIAYETSVLRNGELTFILQFRTIFEHSGVSTGARCRFLRRAISHGKDSLCESTRETND